MGLTGGFADVGGLYDCLNGIYTGQADDSILDKYDEIRRQKYWEVIDTTSSSNLRRLWDPEAIEDDSFIQAVKRAETDPDFAGKMGDVSILQSRSSVLNKRANSSRSMVESQGRHVRLHAALHQTFAAFE